MYNILNTEHALIKENIWCTRIEVTLKLKDIQAASFEEKDIRGINNSADWRNDSIELRFASMNHVMTIFKNLLIT
jgi:hypothetical protein